LARRRQSGRSSFRRELVINLVIGLGIAAILFAIRDLPRFKDVEDASFDWFIQIRQASVGEDAPAFAVIDLDERTYRALGQPYYTARRHLLELLNFSIAANPELIILDFDLSRPGHRPEEEEALREFFRSYPGPAPIIGIVPVIRSLADPALPRIQRHTELREWSAENPNIYWGSALVTVDEDVTVRRWRVWEKSCTRDGEPEVLIPIQVIASLILEYGAPVHDRVQEARNRILDEMPFDCPGDPETARSRSRNRATIDAGAHEVFIQPTWNESRILYSFPWAAATGGSWSQSEHLVIRPALPILSSGSGAIANDWLSDRVVVISGSYDEGGDVHRTPLGEMPGSLVIVNSIHSLVSRGQVIEPPLWHVLAFYTLAILVMSTLFARFDSFWGMVFSGGIVIAALVPLTFYGYNQGVWVNFTLPLTAVWWQRIARKLPGG
jgi:CHASE2 domain-containing sensor protein